MKLPIRVRLTAWYALFVAGVLVALGAFLVLELRSDLRSTIDREVRTSSVTITQMQALRACRNAGITVPKEILKKGIEYLLHSTTERGGVVSAATWPGIRWFRRPVAPGRSPASRNCSRSISEIPRSRTA